MNNYIYQEYSMNDRIKMLQNMSVKSHVKTYNRSLTESEIENEKDKFASDAIELDRQKKELKAQTERLKSGITSVENLMEERLERIKSGQMETTATLYGVPDHNKGVMCWYDSYGERINSTPLTPDEKQGKLFIGDEPVAEATGEATANADAGEQHITDIEFEEVKGAAGEAVVGATDDEYNKAVDEMYNGDGASVDIPVTEPTEDKPAKKAAKGKGKKKTDDDNSPL